MWIYSDETFEDNALRFLAQAWNDRLLSREASSSSLQPSHEGDLLDLLPDAETQSLVMSLLFI